MLVRGRTSRGYTSHCFQSTGFLPFAILLSATKSLILNIDFSLLLLGKRLKGSSRLWSTCLQLRLAGLYDLCRVTQRRNSRWMPCQRSCVLRRLRVLDMRAASGHVMRAIVCRMFAICGGVLGGLCVDRPFGLLFFTACSTHEREAKDHNKKRSHSSRSAPFVFRTATTKWYARHVIGRTCVRCVRSNMI